MTAGFKAALAALALLIGCGSGYAQEFPTKPVKLIVPFPAGGLADSLSRLIGAEMAAALGQPFVIENRGGTGGLIGMEAAARSDPDGYTIVYSSAAAIVTGPLMRPGRQFVRDLTPVGHIGDVPIIMAARGNFEAGSVAQLVALAKATPGRITYGSSGIGSSPHLIGEYFRMTVGIDLVHVPYAGDAPIMNALLGGQLDIGIVSAGAAASAVKGGKLRAIALTGSRRTPLLPDVPTVAESGYTGFAADSFGGLHTRSGTPGPVIDKLAGAMIAAVKKPDIRERMERLSIIPVGAGPEAYGALIRAETEKWSAIIERLNIRLE
jgi:tripartite-type tricarboxylate transporter receptor subunit TctC